jgi:hypothetical protein
MSTASITEIPAPLTLTLRITDRGLRGELEAHPEGRARHDFAVDALRVGVVALRHVEGQVDARKIRDEGERLLAALSGALSTHRDRVMEDLERALREYLDPKDGRFQERVERLIARDGELEQLLRGQIGRDGSTLAATLQEHLGAGSPLMRKLDPAAGDGLLHELDGAVRSVLDAQRERILSEFSLDNRDGALARLVAELTERNGELGKDLGDRVKEVAAELSLDDDDSALSRLVRRVEAAQARINDELTLDEEGSALARLRREILGVLDEQRKNADTFHADVRATLVAVAARREEAARSTAHGHAFEDEVWSFVDRRSQEAGDVPARTGSTPGRIPKCKVGDAVIELGPDHAAAGARIVIEAKERSGVDLGKAREEMATARKNRDAGVGIFVASARTAPAGMAPLRRYGDDVVLVWDSEDPASDVVLAAGLEVARAISVQARAQSDGADLDLEELDRAILAIEKQLAGVKAIETSARTVTRSGDRILGHCEALRTGLTADLEKLRGGVARIHDFLAG